MKFRFPILLIAAFAICLSCTKEPADTIPSTADLLATVPANVAAAGYLETDEIARGLDIRREKGRTLFCPELEEAAQSSEEAAGFIATVAQLTLPTSSRLILFAENDCIWFTAAVSDLEGLDEGLKAAGASCRKAGAQEIADALEQASASSSSKAEGDFFVYTLPGERGTLVRHGRQIWIAYSTVANKIATNLAGPLRFASLERADSFLESPTTASAAKELTAKSSLQSVVFADISRATSMLSRLLPRSRDILGLSSVAIATLYTEPSFIRISLALDDKSATASISLLDSEFRPCRFNLPTAALDMQALESYTVKDACAVSAIAIPAGFSSSLLKMAGGYLPAEYAEAAEAIEGTSVFSSTDAGRASLGIVATRSGVSSPALSAIAAQLASGGNLSITPCSAGLQLSSPGAQRGESLPDFAKGLKGAMAGVATQLRSSEDDRQACTLFRLIPSEQSLTAEFSLQTSSPLRFLIRKFNHE